MFTSVSGQVRWIFIFCGQWIGGGAWNIWNFLMCLGKTEVVPFCWCTCLCLLLGWPSCIDWRSGVWGGTVVLNPVSMTVK